jgi:hypothetical protein
MLVGYRKVPDEKVYYDESACGIDFGDLSNQRLIRRDNGFYCRD